MMRRLLFIGALAALAGCSEADRTSPAAEESASAVQASETVSAVPSPSIALDEGALKERENPDRLLVYIVQAAAAGNWDAAARAWQDGSDGEAVKALLGGADSAALTMGKGEVEGAAGSLYYEVPVSLVADDGRLKKSGSIVLRRVNDVPGAGEASLAWHVERIEWKD